MKKDSLAQIHSDMEFIVGWLARPEMKKVRIGVIGGRAYKPQYVKLECRGYLVNKSLVVGCRRLMRRLKALKK